MIKSRLMRHGVAVILVFIIGAEGSWAQKPSRNQHRQLLPDETMQSYRVGTMRVNQETGMPVALYSVNYAVEAALPEAMARQYLRENAPLLKLREDLSDLRLVAVRKTPAGHHVRFQQYEGEYAVFNATIVVTINHHNRVTFVMNGYKADLNIKGQQVSVSQTQARQAAMNRLQITGVLGFEKTETIVYHHSGLTRLAHRVTLVPSEDVFGDWEVLVDAVTGEIFRIEDKACYAHGENALIDTLQGVGNVFDPDPLTRSGRLYTTPGFGDNNDADSDSLTAQLVAAPLRDITKNGSTYELTGRYAKIMDFEAPFDGTFGRLDSAWFFTRSAGAFEAATVYYHVDKSMRYINETLGLSLMPYQYSTGVQVDPHGLNGDDNSHYITSTGRVAWGEGGVDDSEDEDVILHELGHGLHDWLTNGGLSQVNGLSEGCGDYWAVSYNRSTGFWEPSDPQYNWVFQWDGHNNFWPGRVTNYGAHYPEGLVGQIHTDGQIWASTLMQIWDDIGKEATDLNFLTGLAMTNETTNQEDAAQAFIQADIDNYEGAHLSEIEYWFTLRGYDVSIPSPSITHDPLGDTEELLGPYVVLATVTPSSAPIDSVQLVYGSDSSFADTIVMIHTTGNDYSASIPGTGVPTLYNYYILAIDTSGFAATHPSGAPGNFHVFRSGADTVKPVIAHTGIASQSIHSLPVQISVSVTDNLGVDSVWIDYRINGAGESSFELVADVDDYFTGAFPFDTTEVAVGDSIQYRVFARDNSYNANQSVSPVTGYHQFYIVNELTVSRNVSLSIPDNNTTGVSDTIVIAGSAVISDLNVVVDITHTYVGDLMVTLKHVETGTTVAVIDRPGVPGSTFGCSGADISAILDDEAALPVESECAASTPTINGTFKPNGLLSGFDGQSINGRWVLTASDRAGGDTGTLTHWAITFQMSGSVVDVKNDQMGPRNFALYQNHPNPFNPATTIRYDIKESGKVTLKIYNVLGQAVRTLVNGNETAGHKSKAWDGKNDLGHQVTSGIYFYRLESGNFVKARKMMLLK